MKELNEKIKNCRACPLDEGYAVPGEGKCNKGVMIVAEAPGSKESKTGQPFQGRAGKVLDNAIKEAGFERDDFFISNLVKHRPPENRNPLQEEIEACFPFLEKQTAIINPDLIVTLGKVASQSILGVSDSMRKMRGQPYSIWIGEKWRVVIPTYHPSHCLYQFSAEVMLQEDFKELKRLTK